MNKLNKSLDFYKKARIKNNNFLKKNNLKEDEDTALICHGFG